MNNKLRIATRASRLALWQAHFIKDSLLTFHPDLEIDIIPIKTKGDKILDVTLSKVGGKGLFVKEIEEAPLNNEADLAVHSLKDVPGEMPEGLKLVAYPKRENPFDALLSKSNKKLSELPQGAVIGSSSLRRTSQIARLRPDIKFISLRGNVETRIRKMNEGECDATILAMAGLIRLKMDDLITEQLSLIPAVAQGALGLQTRVGDIHTAQLVACLDDAETRTCVEAEREFLRVMQGGCQVPLGCFAVLKNNRVYLDGFVASPDGSEIIQKKLDVSENQNVEGGKKIALQILDDGGREVLLTSR